MNGSVTSLEIYDKSTVFIGTDTCEIYTLDYQNFVLRLEITCNTSIVYDIAFPKLDSLPHTFQDFNVSTIFYAFQFSI